jgi:hypothetical protein
MRAGGTHNFFDGMYSRETLKLNTKLIPETSWLEYESRKLHVVESTTEE